MKKKAGGKRKAQKTVAKIPEEVKVLIAEFSYSLKDFNENKPIPMDWGDYILLELGLKKKRGGQKKPDERNLQISREILKKEITTKDGRALRTGLNQGEAIAAWLEENEDEEGQHKKYGFSEPKKIADIYRKFRGTAMGEILSDLMSADWEKEQKAQKKKTIEMLIKGEIKELGNKNK